MFSFLSRIRKPRRADTAAGSTGGPASGPTILDLLEAALAEPGESEEAGRELLQQARQVLERHAAVHKPAAALPELLDYVRRYPHTELFQVLVARALEAAHRSDEGLAVWRGIHQRFPDSSEAFILMLRGVKRQQGIEAGRAEIELYFSGGSSSAREILLEAKSWDEIGQSEQADACFERLSRQHPEFENGYVGWAQSLTRRGALWRARDVLQAGLDAIGDGARKLTRRLVDLNADLAALRRLGVEGDGRDVPVSILVLEKMLQEIGRRRNAEYDAGPESFVGPVLMINGSLGAGGAERQFVNTAVAMQSAIQQGQSIAGYGVLGPVQVVCRSLRSREGADFFAATLRDAGIPVSVYSDMQAWGGCEFSSLLAPYRSTCASCPSRSSRERPS